MEQYPIQEHLEAYLDIETTGLSMEHCDITVIGIYLVGASEAKCIQLVGDDVTAPNLLEAVDGVDIIYTYNGSRFDLPFISRSLGIDLSGICSHRDLMFDCWKNNYRGGLKKVEQQLGIKRKLKDISGYDAVRLWWKYVNDYDAAALSILMRYNREDVVNLKELKNILL